MRHFRANVFVINPEIVSGEIVATDEKYERVDYSVPILSFYLGTDRLWHCSKIYNGQRQTYSLPPSCFKPRVEFTNALDEALRSMENEKTNFVEFSLPEDRPVRATGQAAKDLKENEAEEASVRAWAE